jgi:curved DNA-binding protein CbpA
MSSPDLYERLQVSPTADLDAIRAAYRRLAFRYHPDRNPCSADALLLMRSINNAYAILRDPRRRSEYDNFRNTYVHKLAEAHRQEFLVRRSSFVKPPLNEFSRRTRRAQYRQAVHMNSVSMFVNFLVLVLSVFVVLIVFEPSDTSYPRPSPEIRTVTEDQEWHHSSPRVRER